MKHRRKALAIVLACVVLCAGIAFGTLALLQVNTLPITNTFRAAPLFELHYDKNTTDEVTGMPDPADPYQFSKNDSVSFDLTDAVPTRTNYKFLGWAESADATEATYVYSAEGNPVTVTVTKTPDSYAKTLYAVWELDQVKITFHANNESDPEETAEQMVTVNTETALDENTFTYDDNEFLGWNTEADGSGTSYEDQELVTLTAPLDLYAQWQLKVHLSYDGNKPAEAVSDPTGVPETQTEDKSADVTVSSTVPSCAGYRFLGWAERADGDVVYEPGATIEALDADKTLYAKWSPAVCLYFEENLPPHGEEDPQHAVNMPETIVLDIDTEDPTATGTVIPGVRSDDSDNPTYGDYVFLGWAESPDGDVKYREEDPIVLGTADKTLYAKWATKYVNFGAINYYRGGNSTIKNNGDGTVEITAQTGSYEKLNIQLRNLEVGTYYHLGFQFDGLFNPLYTMADYRLGCVVSQNEIKSTGQFNYIGPDGGGIKSMWEYGKSGAIKPTDYESVGYVDLVFKATAENMWWVWDMSAIDDSSASASQFTKLNLNMGQSLVIEPITNYPAETPFIGLIDPEFINCPGSVNEKDARRRQTHLIYADSDEFHANVRAVRGSHEVINIPINNLEPGKQYTVSFDYDCPFTEDTGYYFGFAVCGTKPTTSQNNAVGNAAISEYISAFATENPKTEHKGSVELTFIATAETNYISIPLNGVSDGNSAYINLTDVSLEETPDQWSLSIDNGEITGLTGNVLMQTEGSNGVTSGIDAAIGDVFPTDADLKLVFPDSVNEAQKAYLIEAGDTVTVNGIVFTYTAAKTFVGPEDYTGDVPTLQRVTKKVSNKTYTFNELTIPASLLPAPEPPAMLAMMLPPQAASEEPEEIEELTEELPAEEEVPVEEELPVEEEVPAEEVPTEEVPEEIPEEESEEIPAEPEESAPQEALLPEPAEELLPKPEETDAEDSKEQPEEEEQPEEQSEEGGEGS